MDVTALPIETGISGWNDVLPAPLPANRLKETIHADYLVIGGGFAGLAATQRLRQLQDGANIVLVEANRIGEGPAGRNSGFMIDLPHDLSSDNYSGAAQKDKDEIFLNRTAIHFAQQMADDAKLNLDAFNPCGKINAAATSKGASGLKDYQAHLIELNEPSTLYDAREMKLFTGSKYYQLGLFTPGSVMIQPAAFITGIANHLSQSCQIYENTPVISLTPHNDNYRVKTKTGEVIAKKIILAVNGHIQSFGFFKQQLMHFFTYASTTRQLTAAEINILGGEAQWNILSADPMGSTVRRISGKLFGGDRIMIRNQFTYDPSMEINETRLRHIAKLHRSSFAARFPIYKDIEMQYCWGGRLCLSTNNVPAFGEVQKNIFAASCQNGLGTTKGTLSGMLAAELACGCQSNLLDYYINLQQPKNLMLEPIMSIGANAVLKFKQFQAGKEL